MRKLEVFFDFICPFCVKGHEYLTELRPLYPDLEIAWCPCESHPRPEERSRHSDLLCAAIYFAEANKADMWTVVNRLYKAATTNRIDIDDASAVADSIADVVDAQALQRALQDGTYAKAVTECNHLVWQTLAFDAVPSFLMDGKRLNSVLGVGVTKEQLKNFLDGAQLG